MTDRQLKPLKVFLGPTYVYLRSTQDEYDRDEFVIPLRKMKAELQEMGRLLSTKVGEEYVPMVNVMREERGLSILISRLDDKGHILGESTFSGIPLEGYVLDSD